MSLTEDMFTTLLSVITNAGEEVDGVKFSKVVDNSIASKIYKEFK